MKPYLNGRLLRWVEHLGQVQRLRDSGVLSVYDEMHHLGQDIVALIRAARKDGCNWVWGYDDIGRDVDEDDKAAPPTFVLPTVSIASHFGLDTNNALPRFFKRKGIDLACQWDTESGGWYPRFAHRKDAERCVDTVNELLDERYLKGKL